MCTTGGRTWVLYRTDLEPFWRRLVADGELSKADLETVYKSNSSLADLEAAFGEYGVAVAALLAQWPGVELAEDGTALRYVEA